MYVRQNIGVRMMVWLILCASLLLLSASSLNAKEHARIQRVSSESSISPWATLLIDLNYDTPDDCPTDNDTEDDSEDDTEEREYVFDTSSVNKLTAILLVMALPYAEALYHWSAQSDPDYQPRPPQV